MLIINGEDVTTIAYGHWNAIGLKLKTWIEWRYTPQDNLTNCYTEQVHGDGGLTIINHPFYTPTLTNGFAFDPSLFDGIEVWNGNWDKLDEFDLKWWDGLLKNGKRMLAIGVSDTHVSSGSPNNPGTPKTIVYANALSQQGIMGGLRRRKAYITSLPNLSLCLSAECNKQTVGLGDELVADKNTKVKIKLTFTPLPDATVYIIGSRGVIRSSKMKDTNQSLMVDAETTSYLRLEIRDANGLMLVITNPIWIKLKS